MKLLEEGDVAVSPGSGFGPAGEGYLRMALVENENRLRQAVRQIGRCLGNESSCRPDAVRGVVDNTLEGRRGGGASAKPQSVFGSTLPRRRRGFAASDPNRRIPVADWTPQPSTPSNSPAIMGGGSPFSHKKRRVLVRRNKNPPDWLSGQRIRVLCLSGDPQPYAGIGQPPERGQLERTAPTPPRAAAAKSRRQFPARCFPDRSAERWPKPAKLALEDGTVYTGNSFGAAAKSTAKCASTLR